MLVSLARAAWTAAAARAQIPCPAHLRSALDRAYCDANVDTLVAAFKRELGTDTTHWHNVRCDETADWAGFGKRELLCKLLRKPYDAYHADILGPIVTGLYAGEQGLVAAGVSVAQYLARAQLEAFRTGWSFGNAALPSPAWGAMESGRLRAWPMRTLFDLAPYTQTLRRVPSWRRRACWRWEWTHQAPPS